MFSPLVQFIWVDVNTVIKPGCRPEQPDRDLFEEVVLVRLQTNSCTVCLWYEHVPTSIGPNCREELCIFGLNQLLYSAVLCFVNKQLVVCRDTNMNRGLTWNSNEIHSHLGFREDEHIAQQLEKTQTNRVQNVLQTAEEMGI